MTGEKLVQVFRQCLAEKWGYVYGGVGETWSAAMAEEWIKQGRVVPKNNVRTTYFRTRCAPWIGRRVADCSGGIVFAMRTETPKYPRYTSGDFKNMFVESGPISTIPEIPGLILWRSGHVGIYEGAGKVLEFRGTGYGIVRTELSKRDFTHWGKVPGVNYFQNGNNQSAPDKPAEPVLVKPGAPIGAYFATCSGNNVYIRLGAGTQYTAIGALSAGEKMLALPPVGGWCAVSAYKGGKWLEGYMYGQYVREVDR